MLIEQTYLYTKAGKMTIYFSEAEATQPHGSTASNIIKLFFVVSIRATGLYFYGCRRKTRSIELKKEKLYAEAVTDHLLGSQIDL